VLSGSAVLTTWRGDPGVVVPLVALAVLYGWGVLRVVRRHPRGRWPIARTASFAAGLAAIAIALLSSVGIEDRRFFWIHMVQHLLLIMVAPVFLVAGRPLILALHATRNPWHTRIKQALRSRVVTVVTCPLLSVPLYAAAVVGTHLTSFQQAAATQPAAHAAEVLIYLVTGYLYFLPGVGDEPIRWRMSAPGKAVLILLIMPIDTFTGLTLLMTPHVPWPAYALAHAGGPDPLTDLHWGGAMMWIGGDTIMIALIVAAMFRWLFGRRRPAMTLRWIERARRATFDAQLAVTGGPAIAGGDVDEDEQRLEAYNAWLASISTRPTPPEHHDRRVVGER